MIMQIKVLNKFLIICFVVFGNMGLSAQLLLSTNQDDPSVQWKQVNTPRFRIIYPAGIDSDAMQITNKLEYIYPFVTKTSRPTGHLDIILRTRLSSTNGYATLVPRKVEFFNLPSQGTWTGINDWYSLLSIHEFRHVTQFSRLDTGFARFLHILYGRVGQQAGIVLTTPSWYFEGDAVVTETALSGGGRGRQPQFTVEQKALLLSGKKYSYQKVLLGSYKDWYPLDKNYSYGYLLLSNFRNKYDAIGLEILSQGKTTHRGIKNVSKLRISRYHKQLNEELTQTWKNQIANIDTTPAKLITLPNSGAWTYNVFPKIISKEGVFATTRDLYFFRYGQEHKYSIVHKDLQNNNEEVLYESLYLNNDAPFTVSDGYLVFSEEKLDLRWGMRSYSNLKRIDLKTRKVEQLTHKSRLYAPAISPDGKKIACVEVNSENRISLVLLSIAGEEMKRYSIHDNNLIQMPSWFPDSKNLVYVKIHKPEGKSMCVFNTETGSETSILPKGLDNFAYPVSDGKFIFYQSPRTGIDNVFAVNISTGKTSQITSRHFGAYYPDIDLVSKKLLFSDVSGKGYMVSEMPLDSSLWISSNQLVNSVIDTYSKLVKEEQGKSILDSIPNFQYPIKTMGLLSDPPRVFSWNPDPSGVLMVLTKSPLQDISVGLSGANLKNTTSINGAYIYNNHEKTHFASVEMAYMGWYPIIYGGIRGGGRTVTYQSNKQKDSLIYSYYNWQERGLYLSLALPLNLSAGVYNSSMVLNCGVEYMKVYNWRDPDNKYDDINQNNEGSIIKNAELAQAFLSISYSRTTMWLRDINPRWGQELNILYNYLPSKTNQVSSQFGVNAKLFVPGFFAHHSISVEGAYEKQIIGDYIFSNLFTLPRGYGSLIYNKMSKIGVDYTLPLLYPDLSILHTIYLKRFYASLFSDFGQGRNTDNIVKGYQSAGIEMISNTFIVPYDINFKIGVRYSRLINSNNNIFEAIIKL
jgi:hypothetical protein